MSEKTLDLICIGRSCVDLYSDEFGAPLDRAMSFGKSLGGSPMNIAIGASRLGLKVGAITGVGKEDNGRYLKWQLECEGVDTSNLKIDEKRLTAMVLLSIRGDNDFPLIQYRENCADMGLTPDDIDPAYLAKARAVLVTGTHLSKEGVREATYKILRTAKELGLKCIFDIDYRPNLWGLQGHDAGSSRWAEAAEHITRAFQEVLPYFDLIVGTEEEYRIAGGAADGIAALRAVRQQSKALLVYKLGERGCAAIPGDIPDSFTDDVVYGGFPVKVYNSIGAGDGFMSGFVRGWLRGESIAECCRYANAAGAFAVSRLGCSSAYPSWEELRYFLDHGSKEEWLRKDAMLEQLHWSTTRRRSWDKLRILAFDHRLFFESLAKLHGKGAAHINRCKQLIFAAAVRATQEADLAGNSLGILADGNYGREVLLAANAYPFWVGRSIEKTGPGPLCFEGQADVGMTLREWPENHVVKCLFRPGLDDGAERTRENEEQLQRLFSAARGTGHDLLLELLPEAKGQAGDAQLLQWMNRCYELGLYPDYWKLAPAGAEAWSGIEACIQRFDPYCRGVLLLGQDAPEEELIRIFALAAKSPRCIGFAIGRSIFRDPAEAWFADRIDDTQMTHAVAGSFIRLARAWNQNEK